MSATSEVNRPRRGLTTPAAISIILVLIFLALLLLANEVRYQGCVARIDRISAITADHPAADLKPPDCSRLPFGA